MALSVQLVVQSRRTHLQQRRKDVLFPLCQPRLVVENRHYLFHQFFKYRHRRIWLSELQPDGPQQFVEPLLVCPAVNGQHTDHEF